MPFPQKLSRLYPRSKTGCLTCRLRRKRCGKLLPICSACTENDREYTWPSNSVTTRFGSKQSPMKSLLTSASAINDCSKRLSTRPEVNDHGSSLISDLYEEQLAPCFCQPGEYRAESRLILPQASILVGQCEASSFALPLHHAMD